ncbi:MAG TPA: TMEM175 family protein [Flavitalea sp.]|nr:TMEM175 family protein [Flavitalea sp.]
MGKGRLEAFSDGVLAIVITIMVLELKVPHGDDFASLSKLLPVFISYLLSFVYIGIYWNNHHHMLHAAKEVNGNIMWANMHLLFWLSLVPFATGWMGENHFTTLPVALYGVILAMAGIAYFILSQTLIKHHGSNSTLAQAVGSDQKGKWSVYTYAIAIALAFVNPWISMALYTTVAAIWFIPDRRITKKLKAE